MTNKKEGSNNKTIILIEMKNDLVYLNQQPGFYHGSATNQDDGL
jgi:hypothetical protein